MARMFAASAARAGPLKHFDGGAMGLEGMVAGRQWAGARLLLKVESCCDFGLVKSRSGVGRVSVGCQFLSISVS